MEYQAALKLGEKAYRNAVARGEYPYLPALDEILSCVEVQREEKLGLVDIPLDQIVGTKTSGRKNAFAVNFMPLMKRPSEFADKWSNLYKYQTEEGNTDPIVCYEFINRYYVQEGNKRVSVFKFLDASSIEGEVIRIVPKKSDSLENKIYYEYMDFYKYTKINYIWFTKEGSFEALVKAVGKGPGEEWTKEERDDFSSTFFRFQKKFNEKGGKNLAVTAGDAFLFYLSLYPYQEICNIPETQLRKDVDRIWKEIPTLNASPEENLVMEPEDMQDPGIIDKIKNISTNILDNEIKVAFLHDRSVENSSWTYSHELGRTHLDAVFGNKITTTSYTMEESGLDTMDLMDKAIEDKNDIIFTANQKFLGASLKKALEHPGVKILNCSINRSYHAIQTYYGRMYEAKFLCGMIAGAMTPNNKVAYCASFPIYGAYANANAFALGAQMTNPKVKVYVHWLSDKTADLDSMLKENDITLVSDTDMIRFSNQNRNFGLYLMQEDGNLQLTVPMWNWGKFYEKMVRDILAGNWNRSKAVNYWWGISSDIIDLIVSNNLPTGIRTLVDVMRGEIFHERFHPFQGEIKRQDGTMIGEKDSVLSAEQIITMDWFVENIVGDMPLFENLTDEAKTLIHVQKELTPAVGESIQ